MTLDEKVVNELRGRFTECSDQESMKGDQARREFAQALSVPILQEVRLQSVARDLFSEERLGPQAQAVYPVADDFEVPVWVLPRLGAHAHNYIETMGQEVYVPTFVINFAEEWSIRYARESRVDIPLRAARNAARAVAEFEEESAWRVVFPAGTSGFGGQGVLTPRPAPIVEIPGASTGSGFFSKELLNQLILTLRRNGRTLTDLYISPEDAADIREWTQTDVDDFTRREIFQAAGLGRVWGVQLHVLDHLGAQGKFNINSASSEFGPFQVNGGGAFNDYIPTDANEVDANSIITPTGLGETQVWGFDLSVNDSLVMPIKQDITVIDAGNELLRHQKQGFFGWEEVGFGLLDSRMIVMGVINRAP